MFRASGRSFNPLGLNSTGVAWASIGIEDGDVAPRRAHKKGRGTGMIKIGIVSSGILCWLFAMLLLCGFRKPDERMTREERPVPVKAMRVVARDLARTLDFVGDIRARDEALVYPKVSGKVIEKTKQEGASVAKGEAILFVDRDETGYKFEKAPVESPLTGVVGRVFVDVGSHLTPQTAVALVVNLESVKINVAIPEIRLSEVVLGQTAVVSADAYPGEEFKGIVVQLSPVLDPVTRSAPAEIAVSNAGHRLKPGMYARVKILVAEYKKIPVLLKEAVVGRSENHAFVYAIEGGQAVRKKVLLGFQEEPFVAVKEGVKEGDLVVVVGQEKLQDGSKVVVETMDVPERV